MENNSICTIQFDNNKPKLIVVYFCKKKGDDEKNFGLYRSHVFIAIADHGPVQQIPPVWS